MNAIEELANVLVVVSPDDLTLKAPGDSPLLSRAVALARATGCRLELLHVCHDASLEQGMFAADTAVMELREQIANRDATRLSELVIRLQAAGMEIRHEVRWDTPRADAILRKVAASRPDLIMKEAGDHAFVLGLTANTDWELIRRSPTHVWFVKGTSGGIDRMITAIGTVAGSDEIVSKADYRIFRLANDIARAAGATNIPVHAYQIPGGLNAYATYVPDVYGMPHPASEIPTPDELTKTVARNHGKALRAFTDSFGLDAGALLIRQGHPGDVLPALAQSAEAQLIVMGARNLSRWQRLFQSVAAEPVLAETPCDVLFVKEPEDAAQPDRAYTPTRGEPVIDLEQAITAPEQAFDSPQQVVDTPEISIALRKRILDAWEQDVRAEMVEENEGGPAQPLDPDIVSKIRSARAELAEREKARSKRG